jgi:hypothetical protein
VPRDHLLGLPRMVVAVGWVCRRADAFAEFSGAGTASHPGGWCTRSRRDTRLCFSSRGLSATRQQVFFSQNKTAISNQSAVLSQNKPASAISHQPTEEAVLTGQCMRSVTRTKFLTCPMYRLNSTSNATFPSHKPISLLHCTFTPTRSGCELFPFHNTNLNMHAH